MKRYKKIIAILLGLIGAFLLFITWYQYQYAMDVAESYQVNAANLETKLLIATQGSEFKKTITEGIITHFEKDSVFIEVIDITSLERINPKVYTAIVLIHTWENWKPPAEIESFIEESKAYKEKIIVMTTSGEGSYKMKEVDAIVGESILLDATSVTDKIITRITTILE